MNITMQEYSVKITAGEGTFKFFPVAISGSFLFIFHKHIHLQEIKEE